MTVTDFGQVRDDLIEALAQHVVGPMAGYQEILADLPHRRYLAGTLYPANASTEEIEQADDADGHGGSGRDEVADDPIQLANQWLPSSLGLTLYVSGCETLTCRVWGARYETLSSGRSRSWQRVPISERDSPIPVQIGAAAELQSAPVLDGRASVQSIWRPMPDGYLVTVTLLNIQRQASSYPVDPDFCLHQVGFTCETDLGAILEYPSVDLLSHDAEDAELRLLYRHARTFAIGHGCAADWDLTPQTASVQRVWTSLVPQFEVAPITHSGDSTHEVLRLARLARSDDGGDQLSGDLHRFVASYRDWINDVASRADQLPSPYRRAARRVVDRLFAAADRMDAGVHTLTSDPTVANAFALANLAMLMQMRHSRSDRGGSRRVAGAGEYSDVDYLALDYSWRPFQLAFMLTAAASVADPDHPDREVVDLIWFPTGGGKTEAYLALAAFDIFLRRLRHGDFGAGTAVLTRYTLRLLTAQQFQRAAALACAAELIRRDHAATMGESVISIGLWVGDEASPNRWGTAVERFDEVLNDPEPKNPFQLETCPWCGTEIIPAVVTEERGHYGIRAGNNSFEFYCPSADCVFHPSLPVAVVDDELFARPPTILISTVDKFARLAWESGGSSFFGDGGRHLPPTLIIQDELHLLSGPLGTTVGLYESAVEMLCGTAGRAPKVIASTATIRRAPEQVSGLFGRDVSLFPPPGIDSRDSYFAREDNGSLGRRYVGVMSQSHTAATTMITVASALLQAPIDLGLQGPDLDAYWTLVAYHNSLRELGRTITQARDDIPRRVETIATDQSRRRNLNDHNVVELTSNVSGTRLPSLLHRLTHTFDNGDEISFLASTNMLSVGVDVPRLGLMLVNGQPKTTSEYIQATSRVGRDKVPGLVVAMLSATRPRDRSHYEGFMPYHAGLYRHVEPTSVTPYSLPSRERALHAALVIAVRHGAGLGANDAAGRFDPSDPDIQRVVSMMKERAQSVDPDEADATSRHLDHLVAEWADAARDAARAGQPLYYSAGKQHRALLKDFGAARDDAWGTLHSMRNVDRQCSILVFGEDWD